MRGSIVMDRKSFIRISPDIDVLYIDSDSCCGIAYGDEICNESPSLGPRFSIVVPGIEEWVKRYENATDFVETVTAPSFDRITLHGIMKAYASLKLFGSKCLDAMSYIMSRHLRIIAAQ